MSWVTSDDRRRLPGSGSGAGASLVVARPSSGADGGRPLEATLRRSMEAKLGHDFGSVRVHDGAEAAMAAEAMSARAFTRGGDIVLGRGQPASPALLAHELTHVVQQRTASTLEPRVSRPAERSEELARGGHTEALASVPAVQRDDTGAGSPPNFKLKPSPWFQRSMGRLVVDGFPMGEATLSAEQKAQIKAHASVLEGLLDSSPGSRARVTGHGDAVGTEERNASIGTQRADVVAAELVAAGVPKELIDTDSAGKSQPAVPAKGPEPRNRRAVIGFSPPLMPGVMVPKLSAPTLDIGPKPTPDLYPWNKPKPGVSLGDGFGQPKPGPWKDPAEAPGFDWKRAEEMIQRAREIEKKLPKSRSPLERFGDAAVEVLEPIIKKLPKSLQDKARDGIRSGVEKGTEKACEAGIDASGLTGPEAEGAKAVCKGVLKYKSGDQGGGR